MEIGNPPEDAFRRDLTINALFYNIGTGEVEDLTGMGLRDLSSKVVATPLPSRVTLLDDPLRLLRAVRFATRLGFTISEDLLDAGSCNEVQSALATKVSRERLGAEVNQMLSKRPTGQRDPMKVIKLLMPCADLRGRLTHFPCCRAQSGQCACSTLWA